MVRVLCGQRDRFRQRAQELEEESNRLRSELQVGRCRALPGAACRLLVPARLVRLPPSAAAAAAAAAGG
jgi:hypothetical protein